MSRSTMLLTIAAMGLLGFAFFCRYVGPSDFLIFSFRSQGYSFPPESVCVFMATFLCFFAAIYSFYLVPMNQTAALWHFWLTVGGICVFWIGFYWFKALVRGGHSPELQGANQAAAVVWVSSFVVISIAQGIFATNLISGIVRLRHPR